MITQKGFSLIEVLLSLALIASMALILVQQLRQSKQLINHLMHSLNAIHTIDKSDEMLLLNHPKPSYEKTIRF